MVPVVEVSGRQKEILHHRTPVRGAAQAGKMKQGMAVAGLFVQCSSYPEL